MHKSIGSIMLKEMIDSVYCLVKSNPIFVNKTDHNGNQYVQFKLRDKSKKNLYVNLRMDHEDIGIVKEYDNYQYSYVRVIGVVSYIDNYGNCYIWPDKVMPVLKDSDIIFDRAELYEARSDVQHELISPSGKITRLAYTSNDEFQDNFDMVEINEKLDYQRVKDSPYDANQIDIHVPGLTNKLSIPAYLSASIAPLVDEGYDLDIRVVAIAASDEEQHLNAGIKVNIKAIKL